MLVGGGQDWGRRKGLRIRDFGIPHALELPAGRCAGRWRWSASLTGS